MPGLESILQSRSHCLVVKRLDRSVAGDYCGPSGELFRREGGTRRFCYANDIIPDDLQIERPLIDPVARRCNKVYLSLGDKRGQQQALCRAPEPAGLRSELVIDILKRKGVTIV